MEYYQGYQDGYWQAKSNARYHAVGGSLIHIIFTVIHLGVVLLPLLWIAFSTAEAIKHTYSNDTVIKIALIAFFTYLMYSMLFLLKGIIIGLREFKKGIWVLLWVVCLIFTCGLQIYICQYQLENYFSSQAIANATFWSWAASVILGFLVYSHYSFLTNIAPRSVFWPYKFGFDTIKSIYSNNGQNIFPEKSRTLFGNAKMKVTYRK